MNVAMILMIAWVKIQIGLRPPYLQPDMSGIKRRVRKTIAARILRFSLSLVCLNALAADIIPADRTNAWGIWVWRAPNSSAQTISTFYTPSSPPSASTVNAAIAGCPSNQVIEFRASTPGGHAEYNFTSRLLLNKSGVTLRGRAGDDIVLKNAGTTSDQFIHFVSGGFHDDFSTSTAYDVWTNDIPSISKGSTNLSFKTTPGQFVIGDIIQIDQLEDDAAGLVDASGNSGHCNWCGRSAGTRSFSQTVMILSINNATNLTFEPPLYLDLNIAQTPQAIKHTGVLRYMGIENLTLTNVGGSRDTVVMEGCYRCFIKDCKLFIAHRRHVWMLGGMQNSFTGSSFRFGDGADWSSAYTSDRAYGVMIALCTSFPLVENNVFEKLSYAVAWEGGGRGGVVAYNYCTNIQNDTLDTGKPFTGNHGAHPAMILVEGNFSAARISMDRYWGSSSHWLFLRNRAFITTPQGGTPVDQYWVVFDAWKDNMYLTAVGNIFGLSGVETRFDVLSGESVNSGTSVKAIRRLGNVNANDTMWSGYDTGVSNSILWHLNWESRTNSRVSGAGLHYDPTIAETNIARSMYLSAAPDFQGFLPFPPFDPFNPAASNPTNIAAGYRFINGTNPPGRSVRPGAPINLQVGAGKS